MTGDRPGRPLPPGVAEDVDPDAPLPTPLVALGSVALLVVAALGAALSVLLTPFRIGTALVPVAVVVAVALNIGLPRLGFALSRSRAVAALPVAVFFVGGWLLTISPGGDLLLPGGSGGQTAVSYATLLGGVAVGAVTVLRAA